MQPCAVKPAAISGFVAFIGLMLVGGGIVIEYGFGAQPCEMCWWQRYGHYALLLFGLVGWWQARLTRVMLGLVVLAALVSGSIGVWQAGAQLNLWVLPAFCGGGATPLSGAEDMLTALQTAGAPAPCDSWGFTIMGLSLAMWNVLAMGVTLGVAVWGIKKG